MKGQFIAFWLFPAILLTSASAQEGGTSGAAKAPTTRVINLWPGVAPGSGRWKQRETVLGSGNSRSIVNVTTPTLTVYQPAPSAATGTAVIIAPGGGFVNLSIDSEGHDVAKWLVARGVTAIVLEYRTVQIEGQDAAQLRRSAGARFAAQLRNLPLIDEDGKPGIADGIQAVKVVRAHAAEWGISPDRIVFTGFSAGGMITTNTAIQPDTRPDYAAPIYGAPIASIPPIPPCPAAAAAILRVADDPPGDASLCAESGTNRAMAPSRVSPASPTDPARPRRDWGRPPRSATE